MQIYFLSDVIVSSMPMECFKCVLRSSLSNSFDWSISILKWFFSSISSFAVSRLWWKMFATRIVWLFRLSSRAPWRQYRVSFFCPQGTILRVPLMFTKVTLIRASQVCLPQSLTCASQSLTSCKMCCRWGLSKKSVAAFSASWVLVDSWQGWSKSVCYSLICSWRLTATLGGHITIQVHRFCDLIVTTTLLSSQPYKRLYLFMM